MPIKVTCPGCGKSLKAPDTAAGKKAKCPQCGTVTTLPAAPPAPEQQLDVLDPILDPEPVEEPSHFAQENQEPSPLDDLFSSQPQPSSSPDDDYELASPIDSPGSGSSGDVEPRRPCPMCGEMIPVAALKCRFCDEIFDPTLKRAAKKKKSGGSYADDSSLSTGEVVFALLCGVIGCWVGLIWVIRGKPKGWKMLGLSIASNFVWRLIALGLNSAAGH